MKQSKRQKELAEIVRGSIMWNARQHYRELSVNERINLKGNFEHYVVDGDELPLMSKGGCLNLYSICGEGEAPVMWRELMTPRVLEELIN